MIVCYDVEANGLENPDKIWVVATKNIETGETDVFRNVSENVEDRSRLLRIWQASTVFVGHNFLEYDYPCVLAVLGDDFKLDDVASKCVDTLVVSRLCDYTRTRRRNKDRDGNRTSDLSGPATEDPWRAIKGHSIESYGIEFGYPKTPWTDWSQYSETMVERCVGDVEICSRIYDKFRTEIEDPAWRPAILLEHRFQLVVNDLHNNGFAFNTSKAEKLLSKVTSELNELDVKIKEAFPPKQVLVREFTPRATKFGTISKTSVPRSLWTNISDYEVGKTYPVYVTQVFNPSSHKQLIEVLHASGWRPVDKTQSHVEFDRLKEKPLDKQVHLSKYGFKINENNLDTLPSSAPPGAKSLARRILLESRRRTLTEWLGLVKSDNRIHGRFLGIGAWTGRMSHQKPNTANIPNDLDTQGKKKLLGKELRSLWCAPKGRLLVGVDAEGIQLRIFAHLIDDPEFTDALVRGRKSDRTDPHSLNQRIIGDVCASRQAAKRFIYALLLGAGLWKLSQILECSESETKQALDRLLRRYAGWQRLRETVIPSDAQDGFLVGLDGRKVYIPGTTVSERKHLWMSGALQSGETVCMKTATLKFQESLNETGSKCVNLVHDEWQIETPNNIDLALQVARAASAALEDTGRELKLRCPLAGSYYNDDLKDYTIATNWSLTH